MGGPRRLNAAIPIRSVAMGISAARLYPSYGCLALTFLFARQNAHQLADDAEHDFVGTAANRH